MKICTIEDLEAVNRVLKHPEVYKHISDDNSPPVDDFSAESLLNGNCHILMPNKETVFVFMPHNGSTYDIHITTTPEGRNDLAISAGEDAIEYAFTKIKDCVKLICFIPEIYPNVMRFTEKFNFLKEGKITKSYSKNDKLYDEYIYGLRRSEWQQRQ